MPAPYRVTRRGAIGVAVAGVITASAATLGGWNPVQRAVLTPGSLPSSGRDPGAHRNPLRIPPLAKSTIDADGTRVYDLVAEAGESELLGAGVRTPTWGYNGSFGGPTLRAYTGERVRVRVRNDLDEVTTTHWHGMELPAIADGGPHQPIHPGMEWIAEWTVEQPAASLWYHPHNHGTTEAHVYRGLAGMFIIDADDRAADRMQLLPETYGVDDIPVIITDRSFTPEGAFDERHRNSTGMLGDTILVNGTVSPRFECRRVDTRLRVLNASTARSYQLSLSRGTMLVVATDSGLLPAPVESTGITLTPGERAEIVVHLEPGETAMLRSLPHTLGLLQNTERASGCRDSFDILELACPARPDEWPSFAENLALAGGALAEALPKDFEPHVRRTITLQNNKINKRRMNMARIDEVVTVGTRERWFITNEHFLAHNLHLHNARFLIRSIGGKEPAPELRGWKDTVYAPPSRTVVIDVEFGSASDAHRPYMFHCHLLQHEDSGMMGQYVVVQPGESAGPLDTPALTQGGTHEH